MRHHTVEVAPYSPSYRVYDKDKAVICGEFDCLASAYGFVNSQPLEHRNQRRLSFTLKCEPEEKSTVNDWLRLLLKRPRVYEYYPAANWVILNEFGDIVTKEEIDDLPGRRYRHYWRDEDPRYNAMWEKLIRVKGDAKKVKTNYVVRENFGRHAWYHRDGSRDFDFIIWGQHRYPQTSREIRLNIAHADEYGEEMVRGRRRNLPTSWDDRQSGRWDKRKSWKDSTKRSKQWVPK